MRELGVTPDEVISKLLAGRYPSQAAVQRRHGGHAICLNTYDPVSSCVVVGFDVVQNEDGLHDRCRSLWAAAQLGQDFSGLEGGDGSFSAGPDLRVGPVHGFLPGRQLRPETASVERRAYAAVGVLVALIGEGHHIRAGQGIDNAKMAGGGQIVCRTGQCR